MIEDNQADGHLAKYILEDISVNTKVKLVDDGVKALSYLRKETPYIDATRPDLIILDLNMPRKGGIEVLQELKEDRNLSKIPVVVLTTSTSSDDIDKSYELNANCYVIKSIDFDDFERDIESIVEFWLRTARSDSGLKKIIVSPQLQSTVYSLQLTVHS